LACSVSGVISRSRFGPRISLASARNGFLSESSCCGLTNSCLQSERGGQLPFACSDASTLSPAVSFLLGLFSLPLRAGRDGEPLVTLSRASGLFKDFSRCALERHRFTSCVGVICSILHARVAAAHGSSATPSSFLPRSSSSRVVRCASSAFSTSRRCPSVPSSRSRFEAIPILPASFRAASLRCIDRSVVSFASSPSARTCASCAPPKESAPFLRAWPSLAGGESPAPCRHSSRCPFTRSSAVLRLVASSCWFDGAAATS